MDKFMMWKLAAGALATIGLYSVLYKETKFYRFVEHVFLGLAAGFTIVAVWKDTLRENWYDQLVGRTTEADSIAGYWPYGLLLAIGMMGYMVFSKKHNWISRIPINVIIGLWAGQQVQVFWRQWGPQLSASMQPIIPTTWEQFTVPSAEGVDPVRAAEIARHVYPAAAINNLLIFITTVSVLSYFLFSFDVKNKVLAKTNTLGRWLLMIGLGAIFGSTVMMRFTLVIDRMFFIFIEFIGGMFGLK